jgi:hypothetical protein
VFAQQTGLFTQLAEERLLGRLILPNPALGELPGVLTHALSPEQLPVTITQDDAYVGSVAITINHLYQPGESSLNALFHSVMPFGKAATKTVRLRRAQLAHTHPRTYNPSL